jgi:hypothetical protein
MNKNLDILSIVSEILVDIFPSKTLIIKGVKNEIEPKNLVLILPNFCSYLRNNFKSGILAIVSLTCIATKRPPVALLDYKPGAWGL